MTFLDTHAWLWWLSDRSLVGATARKQIAAVIEQASLAASSMSAWEAAVLVKKGRLELTLGVEELIYHCEGLPFFSFAPITPRIAVLSVQLEPFHADPADRLIVATAMHYGGLLLTDDSKIHGFAQVRAAW